jgi:GT2 family glycosyltransferase
MEDIFISVIIVTRNREHELERTLDNFSAQKYQNKEIIVIDNHSEMIDWNNFQNKFPDVKFILLPTNISLSAFDIGLAEAKGNVIWRTDDDSNPRDFETFNYINSIFSEKPEIDVIATEIVEPLHNDLITNWYPYAIDKVNIPHEGYPSNTFYGAGAAIKKSVFDEIGTFWGFGYEELDFSARAILKGFNIKYYPNIIVDHYCSSNNRIRTQRLVLMAMQQVRYHAKYFSFCKSLTRFITLLAFQNLEAVSIKISIRLLIELNSGMFYSYFHTRNNERVKVPKELVKKITLNENHLLSIVRYFKIRLKRFLNRYRK